MSCVRPVFAERPDALGQPRCLSGRGHESPSGPGHRPSASALGSVLPARWADGKGEILSQLLLLHPGGRCAPPWSNLCSTPGAVHSTQERSVLHPRACALHLGALCAPPRSGLCSTLERSVLHPGEICAPPWSGRAPPRSSPYSTLERSVLHRRPRLARRLIPALRPTRGAPAGRRKDEGGP
jgi:hypothetical protein